MPQYKQQESTLSNQELRILAEELIKEQSTMTLATARGNAQPGPRRSTTSFIELLFYFFSDAKSRHIQESMENCHVSAAIYPSVFSWREIRGIDGGTSPTSVRGMEVIQVIRAYLKKFPFTKEFFDSGEFIEFRNLRKTL